MSKAQTEIRIGGFGGQGVILSGIIIGKAFSIYDGKHATLTQAFGPEARGSACSAQVILSPEPILYPYVAEPATLIVMSQEAYTKFSPNMKKNGILLYEEDLVQPDDTTEGIKSYSIPATRFAEELGRKLVLNIVMVGFFSAISGLLSEKAAKEAVAVSVPKGTEELNLKAFKKGYEYGKKLL